MPPPSDAQLRTLAPHLNELHPFALTMLLSDRITPFLATPPIWKENESLMLLRLVEKHLMPEVVSCLKAKNKAKMPNKPNTERTNSVRLATVKLLRKIADFPVSVDRCILWLWAAVHSRQDATTVFRAVEPLPSRAQKAWVALDRRVEQWMQASRILRLIRGFVNWLQKLRPRPEVHCVGAAALGAAVIVAGWCGGPFRFGLSAIPHAIVFGVGLLFVAVMAANLMVTAVLVVVFALVVPIQLWRLAELISGFVVRRLLPRGVAWRYRAWQLRRSWRLWRGGRPHFLSTLRIDSKRLARMERDYPGITAQIHGYDSSDLPTCPNCYSNDTAAVSIGLVGRSMNIAFATTKFKLLANGPKPGAYYCNQCGRYFDGSNQKTK